MSPGSREEGHKAAKRTGRCVLWGEAEGTCIAQSREAKARRWPLCSLQVPEEGSAEEGAVFTWEPMTGRTGMAQSCIRGGSDQTVENISLLLVWPAADTGFLGWWLIPHQKK